MITCHSDPLPVFVDRVQPWLLRDPVLHNVMLSELAARRGTRDDRPAHWIRAVDEAGEVVGAAMHTPPYGLMIGQVTEAVAHALADHAAAHLGRLPGAFATDAVSAHFAARYAEVTGTAARPRRRSRVFRLDTDPVPPFEIPGRAREATAADRDLLIAWTGAFVAEAEARDEPVDNSRPIDHRLAQDRGLLWLWEDGGGPVAMAWITPPVGGMARINAVYTPRERRGRGYASGCVAAASRHAQTALASTCMLYTDLANPTSNKIYQALGYRAVADVREWVFPHSASRRSR
jgi:predicted GNAT family acetyltransferase